MQKTEKTQIIQRAYQLINAIEPRHFKELTAFCAFQLMIGRRHHGAVHDLLLKDASDLLHDATERILIGLRDPVSGRHPNADDVKNMKSCLLYMRNVVRSIRYQQAAAAARRSEVISCVHDSREEDDSICGSDPCEEMELRESMEQFVNAFKDELENPEKFSAVLDEWSDDFFTHSRLSELGVSSKDATKLRAKVKRIYAKLIQQDCEAQQNTPHDMETDIP